MEQEQSSVAEDTGAMPRPEYPKRKPGRAGNNAWTENYKWVSDGRRWIRLDPGLQVSFPDDGSGKVAFLYDRPISERDAQENPPVPTWSPYDKDDEEIDAEAAVYRAVGAASMCWENPGGAGVFDTDRARAVAVGLLDWLADYIAGPDDA